MPHPHDLCLRDLSVAWLWLRRLSASFDRSTADLRLLTGDCRLSMPHPRDPCLRDLSAAWLWLWRRSASVRLNEIRFHRGLVDRFQCRSARICRGVDELVLDHFQQALHA